MSLADDILIILTSYSGGYKLMRQKLTSPTSPRFEKQSESKFNVVKDKTFRITLSRLKKRGLVENKNRIWKITRRGKEYISDRLSVKILKFSYPKSKNKKKNMIITFDIPERERRKRN